MCRERRSCSQDLHTNIILTVDPNRSPIRSIDSLRPGSRNVALPSAGRTAAKAHGCCILELNLRPKRKFLTVRMILRLLSVGGVAPLLIEPVSISCFLSVLSALRWGSDPPSSVSAEEQSYPLVTSPHRRGGASARWLPWQQHHGNWLIAPKSF